MVDRQAACFLAATAARRYTSFFLSLSLSVSLSLSLSPLLSPSLILTLYLTLPVDDEDDEQGLTSPQHTSPITDSFDEVYKPFELTDFDGLLAKNIGRPIE